MDTSQLPIIMTILTSVAVVVWRFSSVATKLENLTVEVRELLKDFKAQHDTVADLKSAQQHLAYKVENLEGRVDKLEG